MWQNREADSAEQAIPPYANTSSLALLPPLCNPRIFLALIFLVALYANLGGEGD
jgi:hypothetical protein